MALGDKEGPDESGEGVRRPSSSANNERFERTTSDSDLWEAMNMISGELPEVFSDSEEVADTAGGNNNGEGVQSESITSNVQVSFTSAEQNNATRGNSTERFENMDLVSTPILSGSILLDNSFQNQNQPEIQIPEIVVTRSETPVEHGYSDSSTGSQPEGNLLSAEGELGTAQIAPAQEFPVTPFPFRQRLDSPRWLPLLPRRQQKNFRCDWLPNYLYKLGQYHPASCRDYLSEYIMSESQFNGDGERIRNYPEISRIRPSYRPLLDIPIVQLVAPQYGEPFDMFANPYPEWLRLSLVDYEYLPIRGLSQIQIIVLIGFRCVELYFSQGRRSHIDLLDLLINRGFEGLVDFLQIYARSGNLTVSLNELPFYLNLEDEELD